MVSSSDCIRTFDGAVAIVTGGASGIGRTMAEALAQRGCEVVLADRQVELAKQVAASITEQGGRAEAAELDVRDYENFKALVDHTKDRTGRVDFLFNNAGIAIAGEALDMSHEHWDHIIDVNIRGVTNGVHAAYPVMRAQGYGHIVNTASMAGLGPVPLVTAYAMTKHAVVGLSISLRMEAKTYGVRVSALCPGFIRTPILSGGKYGAFVGHLEAEKASSLLDRMVRPYDAVKFARKALNAIAKNRPIIIVPWPWRLVWLATRASLGGAFLVSGLLTKRARKEIEAMSGDEP
jgi:NAD(P)-dependent dehydrogenase (short-subunit alcohol dehydrogenase family)